MPPSSATRHAAESALQKIEEIPADAIDGERAEVVEMEVAAFIGFADFGRIYLVEPVGLAYFGKNIVVETLERVAHVAILFDLPV